jgi:chemotaxis protein CheD
MTEEAPTEVSLHAGDFHFSGDPSTIRTVLGTCIAITIWHPVRHIGGMCHFLLPRRGTSDAIAGARAGLYAEEVFGLFAASLEATQTRPSEYVAKIFGGGNMFPEYLQSATCRKQECTDAMREECPTIGCQNISAAKRLLSANNYTLTSQDVGGHGSRYVVFETGNGDVWVRRGVAMSGIDKVQS